MHYKLNQNSSTPHERRTVKSAVKVGEPCHIAQHEFIKKPITRPEVVILQGTRGFRFQSENWTEEDGQLKNNLRVGEGVTPRHIASTKNKVPQ